MMTMTPLHDKTPDELKGIVEVLEKSLSPRDSTPIPPLPEDLRERLKRQYAEASSPVPVPSSGQGVFSRIWKVVAQPVFSGAFAALVLVAVLGSLFLKERPTPPEQMRGAAPSAPSEREAQTILVLFELSEEQREALHESGYFEPSLIEVASDEVSLSHLVAREGESLIIDGREGELRREDGACFPLPSSNSELADAVLDLLNK